jgi:hypothetical protein
VFKRLLKSLVGLLLIPASLGAAISLYQNLKLISLNSLSGAQLIFLYGIFFYGGLHLFFFKPHYLYIFGHELIHAMATWICGGKVSSFKVSSEGGSVKTSKSNFFISLAPYFIPAYVVIFSIIYFVFSLFFEPQPFSPYFIFLMGASVSFHLVMTADILKRKQSDILKTGYIFSLVLIFLFNLIVLGVIFSWLFEGLTVSSFFKQSFYLSKDIYIKIFNQLFSTS